MLTRHRHLLAACLLVGVTLAAYWPSLNGQFLFDDVSLVTNSPLVKAGDGLYGMWFTTQAVDYWPLTNSSFWLEWRLWGANPTGYHAVNIPSTSRARSCYGRCFAGSRSPARFLAP